MAEKLPHLDDITQLSPRVIRILGHNPGKFALQGTNTYLIGTGSKRTLIDTGEGRPEWLETLKTVLISENATIDRVILTHWHHDHTSGVPALLSHYASLTPSLPPPTIHKNQSVHPDPTHTDIPDGTVFHIADSTTLTALHTPGHAGDHVVLVLSEEDAMFTGDNVLGHGTAVFEDLATYMASLARMGDGKIFGGRAYPGHGEVIADGPGKVREYIAHRRKREEEVLGCLRGESGEGRTAGEMVKVIYKDYPESLHGPAEGGVRLVLGKLEGEGKVRKVEGERWVLGGPAETL